MSKFHESKAWRKLAAEHKTFRCACKSKDDIQSAHYLPQKRFPMMRLWKANLYISCGKCNRELGDKIYWSPQAIKLLGIYYMIKILMIAVIIIILALIGRFIVIDLNRGPFDTTITGQIIAETWEYIKPLLPADKWP